jgi:hypothetical protein
MSGHRFGEQWRMLHACGGLMRLTTQEIRNTDVESLLLKGEAREIVGILMDEVERLTESLKTIASAKCLGDLQGLEKSDPCCVTCEARKTIDRCIST